MFYELAASSWDQRELDAINRVVATDRFTMGPEVAAFEDEFARYHGMKHGVMVNSGSSANLIAVGAQFFKRNKPLQRGDEVIVPAISWGTTYHPLQQYGLKLRIVDVDLETLNMDTAQLEDALTDKTKMLVAVSILGNPCDLDVMRAFCDKHDLVFMEDNCESLDAEIAGKKAGTFGDVNTFSFFFSHHIGTMEGGMVLTDDLETYHLLKALRAHGWTRDIPRDSPIFERKDEDFFEAYRFILPGYNVRPTEISGAIGREQLKKLPEMTAQRRKNFKLFNELFGDDARFIIQRENGTHSSFCFPIVLNPNLRIDRKRVFEALAAADIGYRIITGGCILRHDVMKFYDYETVGEIANAMVAHDSGFFVGNHPHDLTPQLMKLRDVLDQAAVPA
ncbi:MAG: DegT/DnrJ/EryC1/StrS family aminotransferase [Proteobacteria bacterium]|nr:DegT/DnrJ/EryC1/StrS family aminotransferase [Pseudomonadota bacterium]